MDYTPHYTTTVDAAIERATNTRRIIATPTATEYVNDAVAMDYGELEAIDPYSLMDQWQYV